MDNSRETFQPIFHFLSSSLCLVSHSVILVYSTPAFAWRLHNAALWHYRSPTVVACYAIGAFRFWLFYLPL